MRRRLQELPHNLVWLLGAVAFWCLLWGGVDLKNILGGLLAAILVFVLFPMPPMGHELTLRPLRFAYFLAHFVFDLVRSAIEVGWWAVRSARHPLWWVVAMKVCSHSAVFLSVPGILCSRILYSVVVEALRATGTIFLLVVGPGSSEDGGRARQRSVEQEHRLLWAIGRRELLE